MTLNLPLEKLGLQNLHVSVPLILSLSVDLVQVWAPQWYAVHMDAVRQTQRILFAYGILRASTLGPPKPNGNGTTPPVVTTPAPIK